MKKIIKKYYNKDKELIHNFIWRSLQIAGKQGITFFIFVLCAKLLTPYDFGIYNYVIAIIFFLIMFGDFGISTATSKYVAEYNITDKEKLKLVLFNSGLIIFVLTNIIIILTLIFGHRYFGDRYLYVLWLLPLIFLAPMTSLYDGVYGGLKKFKKLALISLACGSISIILAYYFVNSYELIGAMISQNFFYLILLIGLVLGHHDFRIKFNKAVAYEIGKYSLAFGIAIVGYYLFSRVAILILGHYDYINEISLYELLNKIFMIALIPVTILGTIVAPNFTKMYVQKEYKKILLKFKKYFFIFIFIAIFFAIFSHFLTPYIFLAFFKEYYGPDLYKMMTPVILIYASLFYCTVINTGIIISTGYAKIMAYSNMIFGIFNIFLSILLLRHFGYIGVIYSTLFLHVVAIVFYHIVYYFNIKNLSKKYE